MTERNVATVIERLMGEHAPYLHDELTQTVAGKLVTRAASQRPAHAVVINLDDVRSHLRGVSREFSQVDSVEVYM
jgi:hypothetical protein